MNTEFADKKSHFDLKFGCADEKTADNEVRLYSLHVKTYFFLICPQVSIIAFTPNQVKPVICNIVFFIKAKLIKGNISIASTFLCYYIDLARIQISPIDMLIISCDQIEISMINSNIRINGSPIKHFLIWTPTTFK